MKLTCAQMDVLISFYIDDELNKSLKLQVEEHLRSCSECRAKYEIIKSMLVDIKNSLRSNEILPCKKQNFENQATSQYFRLFKTNLSAYIDNELTSEENVKMKKFTINNKKARKELEDIYSMRRLMNESYIKTKNDAKVDFTKNIMKQLKVENEEILGIHPAIKYSIISFLCIIFVTTIAIFFINI